MSDAGRKPFGDKVNEAITPESQKSTFEKGKEAITNKVDEFAAKGTPDNQKSFGQSVADLTKQGHDDAKAAVDNKKSELQKDEATLADTASEYIEAAKEQAANAAQYVSSVMTGATEGAKNASEDAKK